jgi:hypothetical protein
MRQCTSCPLVASLLPPLHPQISKFGLSVKLTDLAVSPLTLSQNPSTILSNFSRFNAASRDHT